MTFCPIDPGTAEYLAAALKDLCLQFVYPSPPGGRVELTDYSALLRIRVFRNQGDKDLWGVRERQGPDRAPGKYLDLRWIDIAVFGGVAYMTCSLNEVVMTPETVPLCEPDAADRIAKICKWCTRWELHDGITIQEHPTRFKKCSFTSLDELDEDKLSKFVTTTGFISMLAKRLEPYVNIHAPKPLAAYLVNSGVYTWVVYYVGKAPKIALSIDNFHDHHQLVIRWAVAAEPQFRMVSGKRKCVDVKDGFRETRIEINLADPDIIDKIYDKAEIVFAGMRTTKYMVLKGFMWLP